MALNPNIILGYQSPDILSPEEKQAKAANLQNILLGQKSAQLEYDTKNKQMQDDQAYKDYFKANPKATGDDLRSAGFVKQGYDADKFSTEQARAKSENMKLQLENVKAKAEFGGQAANYVLKNPTIQNAHMAIDSLLQRGIITPEEAQAEKSTIPQDESQIAGWAEGHVRQAVSIKDQLAKYETKDAGGTVQTQQIDPITGQVKTVNTINKTQSPDNIATNQTSRLNNQDSNATSRDNSIRSANTTIRGQNLTDSREKEKLSASGGGKAPTEDQGKAAGWLIQATQAFDNMKAASSTDKNAKNMGFGEKILPEDFGGNWSRSATRQQYLQGASSLSEALLRAATGAGVNKDEAQQKIREITPQLGDSDDVITNKEAAIPLYIESLKVRAGRAAQGAEDVLAARPPRPILPKDATINTPTKKQPSVSNW